MSLEKYLVATSSENLSAWRNLAKEIANHPDQLKKEALLNAVADGSIPLELANLALDDMEAHDVDVEEDRSILDVDPLPAPLLANLWDMRKIADSNDYRWQAPTFGASEEGLVDLIGFALVALGEGGMHKVMRWLEHYAESYGIEVSAATISPDDLGDLTEVVCEQCDNEFGPDFEGQSLCSDECLRQASDDA
jgi:hypothetical protein